MNRDEVIRMAREAHGPLTGQWFDMDVEALERFAALVEKHVMVASRAAERAALAQEEQEPVASIYISANGDREMDDWRVELPVGRNQLYAAPPQRKPLTDEEIKRATPVCADFVSFRAGVRFMEREIGV